LLKKQEFTVLHLRGPVAADRGQYATATAGKIPALQFPAFAIILCFHKHSRFVPLGPLFSRTFPVRSVKTTRILFRFSANQDFLSQPHAAGFTGCGSLLG
jgi:hypothetical protein